MLQGRGGVSDQAHLLRLQQRLMWFPADRRARPWGGDPRHRPPPSASSILSPPVPPKTETSLDFSPTSAAAGFGDFPLRQRLSVARRVRETGFRTSFLLVADLSVSKDPNVSAHRSSLSKVPCCCCMGARTLPRPANTRIFVAVIILMTMTAMRDKFTL